MMYLFAVFCPTRSARARPSPWKKSTVAIITHFCLFHSLPCFLCHIACIDTLFIAVGLQRQMDSWARSHNAHLVWPCDYSRGEIRRLDCWDVTSVSQCCAVCLGDVFPPFAQLYVTHSLFLQLRENQRKF